MSGRRLPSRCPTLLEKVPIQDGDTASFYVDDLTEEAYNDPLHVTPYSGRRAQSLIGPGLPGGDDPGNTPSFSHREGALSGSLFPGLNCTSKHPSPFQAGP